MGGFSGLVEKYMKAIPSVVPEYKNSCAVPVENAFRMLRPLDDPTLPWLGFILGQTPASIWYWCADQMMVQRLLAAKSLSHAQGGTLFAGFLKITPLFFIIIPGMISRVLFTDEVACVDAEECFKFCGNAKSCSNTAYPRLVLSLMPSGLRGLMLAVMLAALTSDLTSIFNSASTLFTVDIWPRFRKETSVKELMIVGRSFVLVMVVISIAWIPVIEEMQGGHLFIYIQSVSAYLAPPIAAVYLLAVLWPRLNEKGAFWSLILSFFLGLFRMILDVVYKEPECGEPDYRPFIVRNVHYMYMAMILFSVTSLVAVVISLSTEPPSELQLIRTTYWTRHDTRAREDDKDNLELKKKKTLPETAPLKGQEEEVEFERAPKTSCGRFVTWFCGYEEDAEAGDNNNEREQAASDRLDAISSLKQTKFEKAILRTTLGFVVFLAASLFLYFSLPLQWRPESYGLSNN